MYKKRKKSFILFGAFLQITLLVSMSFALAFLISKEVGIVSADEVDPMLKGDARPIADTSNVGEKTVDASNIPATKSGATITNTPTKSSGFFSKLLGGAKEVNYISDKPFSFNPGIDSSLKDVVEIGKEARGFTQTQGGGGYINYADGTRSPLLNPEQYTKVTTAAKTEGAALTGQKEGSFLSIKTVGATTHLVQGLTWSIFVVGAIQLIGGVAGLDKQLTNSLSIAAFAGIMAGKGLAALGPTGSQTITTGILAKPGFQFAFGLAVAAAVFILTYKTTKKKMVTFQCLPFEPALGGAKCEECNKDPFRPCSEYRCKALGQACQLLNPGTKEEKCAWVSPKDVTSPTITPWLESLAPKQYNLKFVTDTSIRPPALGVKIVSGNNGCLPAFTPLEFGITTNEPSQCKIDYNHTNKLDEMQYYFGGSNYFLYNHTQQMRLPGPDTGTEGDLAPELENDGTFALYVRCRDANGNENVDEYAVSFCVDQGPDTTPPLIEGFSIPTGSPVTYNQENVPIEVYTNEPAYCKWSRESKAYNEMENTMLCALESFQINANLVYSCSGNLTSVKNQEENKFYFRCKDKANNENVASTELVLRGSRPLNILSVGPNETIFGSTEVVPVDLTVETDDGSDEGKAICYFSPTGEKDSYIAMFETSSFQHKQSLSLTSGDYKYYFRCVDAGGNAAEAFTSFSVFIDKAAPSITRAYKDEKENALKIVTNEDAACVYSLKNCNYNFNEGLKMLYSNPDIKTNHYAEWKLSNTYYIKCFDTYGNEPDPNKCNIAVSAVQLVGKK